MNEYVLFLKQDLPVNKPSLPTLQFIQTLHKPIVKLKFICLIQSQFLSYHQHFSHDTGNVEILLNKIIHNIHFK